MKADLKNAESNSLNPIGQAVSLALTTNGMTITESWSDAGIASIVIQKTISVIVVMVSNGNYQDRMIGSVLTGNANDDLTQMEDI